MNILCRLNAHKWSKWTDPYPVEDRFGTLWFQSHTCNRCNLSEPRRVAGFSVPGAEISFTDAILIIGNAKREEERNKEGSSESYVFEKGYRLQTTRCDTPLVDAISTHPAPTGLE